MFKRLREKAIIKKIRRIASTNSLCKKFQLNTIRTESAVLLMHDKITEDFYKNVFCTGMTNKDYWIMNKEYIENY